MIVTLKDRTAIITTKDEADKIKNAIEDGDVGIELGSKWFRADWVASIMPGGNIDMRNYKQIEAPDNHGVDSPAKEKLRKDMEKFRKNY